MQQIEKNLELIEIDYRDMLNDIGQLIHDQVINMTDEEVETFKVELKKSSSKNWESFIDHARLKQKLISKREEAQSDRGKKKARSAIT